MSALASLSSSNLAIYLRVFYTMVMAWLAAAAVALGFAVVVVLGLACLGLGLYIYLLLLFDRGELCSGGSRSFFCLFVCLFCCVYVLFEGLV